MSKLSSARSARATLREDAFTLIELLAAIAVLLILAAMLLPAAGAARGRADKIACLSNLRQFGVALQLYAGEWAENLPPNMDGRDASSGKTWVEGWLGLPGPDRTNTMYLQRSLLAPYLGGQARIWRCPASEPVLSGDATQIQVRTVSLNCFVGTPIHSPAAATYQKISQFVQLPPSKALSFIDEWAQTINDGSFAMQWGFKIRQPETWQLRDKPTASHNNGANLVFIDGHVETRRWVDKRTIDPPRDDAPMPGSPDVFWLQERATFRGPAE